MVVDVGADQLAGGVVPAVPMAPGDSVTVLAVARRPARVRDGSRQRLGRGPGWLHARHEAERGAIKTAGGPKPDVYLDRILVSRTNDDSTKSSSAPPLPTPRVGLGTTWRSRTRMR